MQSTYGYQASARRPRMATSGCRPHGSGSRDRLTRHAYPIPDSMSSTPAVSLGSNPPSGTERSVPPGSVAATSPS